VSEKVRFGSKSAADAVRDRHEKHLCSDDDRRLKMVEFASTTPEAVIEEAEVEAADSRQDADPETAGQVPLTESERSDIDFTGEANVPHARSVKGIAASKGVSDWSAYYDASLTVDEHREVMERASKEGGGRRREDQTDATEKAGEAAKVVKSEECDHARGHCANGEPEACEFLTERCDYSQDRVEEILGMADTRDQDADDTDQTDLVTVGGGEYPEMEVTEQVAGALSRSWQGYKGGVNNLDDALDTIREAVRDARTASRAINAIREGHGQEAIHFNRLHDLLASLDDLPGGIPEVRTLDHFTADGEVDSTSTSLPEEWGPTSDRAPPAEVYDRADPRTRAGVAPAEQMGIGIGAEPHRDHRNVDRDRPEAREHHRETLERHNARRIGRRSLDKAPVSEPLGRTINRAPETVTVGSHGTTSAQFPSELAGMTVSESSMDRAEWTGPETWARVMHSASGAQRDRRRYTFSVGRNGDDGESETVEYGTYGDISGVQSAADEVVRRIERRVRRLTRENISKAPQSEPAGRTIEAGGGKPDPVTRESGPDPSESFGDVDQQASLDVSAEKEEKAGEDTQVTLGGGDASDPTNQALPDTWERSGTNYVAGPFKVSLDTHDGERWTVRLFGDDNHVDIATDVRSAARAEDIMAELVDRLDPEDVSFNSSDPEVMDAAAAAKKAAADSTGGLSEFGGGSGN
jgi:hypothetical protein